MPPRLPLSALGPGCVKTCLSQGCAELFSQFPSLNRTGKCNWFSHRQNREGISTRKLNVRVLTQPGSLASIVACLSHVRLPANLGLWFASPPGAPNLWDKEVNLVSWDQRFFDP